MMDELRDFDLSVRVALASSALCGDATPSVVLKLRLSQVDGAERTVWRQEARVKVENYCKTNFLLLVGNVELGGAR